MSTRAFIDKLLLSDDDTLWRAGKMLDEYAKQRAEQMTHDYYWREIAKLLPWDRYVSINALDPKEIYEMAKAFTKNEN